jgi:hypothetical protein
MNFPSLKSKFKQKFELSRNFIQSFELTRFYCNDDDDDDDTEFLGTLAANGPTSNYDEYRYLRNVERKRKSVVLGEKRVTPSVTKPQIPRGLLWD